MATKEQTKKTAAKTAVEVKKSLEKVVPKLEKVVATAKDPKQKKAAVAVLENTKTAVKKIAEKKAPVKGSNARANKMAKDAKADSKISEALKNVSARAMSEIKSINH